MSFGGFEKDRDTLKYRCHAVHYGIRCKGMKEGAVGKASRIKRSFEPRVFTPPARSSYAREREYKKRTAVGRIRENQNELMRSLVKSAAWTEDRCSGGQAGG